MYNLAMSVWTLGDRQFGSHITIPLLVDGRDYGDLEAETDADLELARFIVDACNRAEQRLTDEPPEPRVVHVHRPWPALRAYPRER